MKIKDAEAKLGKVKGIQLSEIEAREYATFARQPKHFGFRVEQGAGIYPGKGEAPINIGITVKQDVLRQFPYLNPEVLIIEEQDIRQNELHPQSCPLTNKVQFFMTQYILHFKY